MVHTTVNRAAKTKLNNNIVKHTRNSFFYFRLGPRGTGYQEALRSALKFLALLFKALREELIVTISSQAKTS